MSTQDEDALNWDGDDDPTLSVTPETDQPAEPQAEAPVAEEPGDVEPEEAESRGMSNVALIAFGVIGGVYAMWVVGWILGTNRVRDWILQASGVTPDAMFQASAILAPVAPVLWFAATLLLTRKHPAWQKFVWLLIGVVVLTPWPFIPGVMG